VGSAQGTTWYLYAGVVLLGLYVVFVVLFDRCFSARPSWRGVIETLRGLRGCRGLPEPAPGVAADRFHAVQQHVDAEVDRTLTDLRAGDERQPFINSTVVLSAWRTAHDLDRLCWGVAPEAAATEHLYTVRGDLASNQAEEAKEMVSRIDAFKHTPTSNPWPLLDEALDVQYDQRDTLFESLANRQTTGSWMAIFGAGLLVVLGLALHHEVLMLFGVVGGVLSRTQRLLSRRPSTDDYGVSAVLFILAPLVGALAGWAGIALLQGLVGLKVLDQSTFGSLWTNPMQTAAFALAFAFGFVERLTDRVAALVAGAIPSKGASAS
jgi:hypothetical protein